VTTALKTRRAIVIIRVSQVGGREGESFASPGEQRERIEAACERDGLVLVEVVEELDVSGRHFSRPPEGLLAAVEAIESVGEHDDRLSRLPRMHIDYDEARSAEERSTYHQQGSSRRASSSRTCTP
jgi:hypothetical protein